MRRGTRAWWVWSRSRIKDRIRRPVIAFARAGDGGLRGSARSVPGIHIRDVLDAIAARHPELISRFGGHAMAAGLSLDEQQLDEFARAFDAEVARWRDPSIRRIAWRPTASFRATKSRSRLRRRCATAGPGAGVSRAVLRRRFAVKNARVVGDKHLKLWVTSGDGERSFDAIAFNFKGADENPRCRTATCAWCTGSTSTNTRESGGLQLLVDHVLA
jgi:single-stranded-DNA-specific exonuclease